MGVRWLQRLICCWVVLVGVWGIFPSHSAIALTEEQKLFNEAWRIVNQAYVDPTFNGQNWWLVREKVLKRSLGDREATYTAIQGMLATLEDPFTRFLRPEQFRSLQTTTAGELIGVGLQISTDPETGVLEVIAPIDGSPAAQAGIQPRDRILAIDGVPTAKLSLDEAAERMRGTAGSVVHLLLQRGNEAPQELILHRGHIEINPVTAEVRQVQGHTVGYIRLSQFSAMAPTEMRKAIQMLEQQGAEAYILDLRNNPGGLLQAGVEIAQLWLDSGVIVYTVDRQGIIDSLNASGGALTHDPLVVLVNSGTASASEILAGALQDHGRARLVGDRTYGKGSIQSLFSLSDGSGLAVTIAHYETPNHHNINKVGIEPDRRVLDAPESLMAMGTAADPQYLAALELLHSPMQVATSAG
ncbi:MAG: carboxyl-terminal processing protease [Thermosynechococcus sp.]|uniref:carboxyl-terminal processing protease CtpA n=1 Tax=Thermosynechococcus sp. TaxID=2814275 RepID=UPI0021FA2EA4|nr:carboxyl-terminal processing protease CtpA [Thermosynechococcus sp.]BCX13307.1 MAG: carboxyl-terminal processing protease [Thermosynechococcus sp.]